MLSNDTSHANKDLKINKPKRNYHWYAYLILTIGGLIFLYPLIFSLLAGLYSMIEFATSKLGILPWPQHPTLQNFSIFFHYSDKIFYKPSDINIAMMGSDKAIEATRYLFNSTIRTVFMTVMAVLTSLLGGYAFGRLRWTGRDKIFLFLLALQIIPPVIGFLPTYLTLYRWPLAGGNNILGQGGTGIYNTYGIYFYSFCAINVMGTFLVRQALQRTPIELDEAARVDGAGTFRIIFTLLAPLQKPVLSYVALTTAISTWNDWLVPFFFTREDKFITLPGAITKMTSIFSAAMATPNYPLLITFGLAVTIPCIILFAFFQRYMVEGLANTGIKG